MQYESTQRGEPLTEEQAQDVAKKADVTLISVMRRLLGWPVRGRAGERIDEVLTAREP
jgi:hypothetical protein